MLNHAGVCVSYTTAWKYLKKLTVESRYLDIVREEHWIWAYDNLNINLKVRHERVGKCMEGGEGEKRMDGYEGKKEREKERSKGVRGECDNCTAAMFCNVYLHPLKNTKPQSAIIVT